MMADLPHADRDVTGWVMIESAPARLRCSACGQAGGPEEVRFSWSSGVPQAKFAGHLDQ